MNTTEIIERIMTDHWDFKACDCWICTEARTNGLRPTSKYLRHNQAPEDRRPQVAIPTRADGAMK